MEDAFSNPSPRQFQGGGGNSSTWFIQIVQVSNRHTQLEVLELCRGLTGIIAMGTSNGHEHFIVVEASDLPWQTALERPVSELDAGSHLVQTCGPNATSLINEAVTDALLGVLGPRTRRPRPDAEPGPERRG